MKESSEMKEGLEDFDAQHVEEGSSAGAGVDDKGTSNDKMLAMLSQKDAEIKEILSNPQVLEILRAQQEGRKVKLMMDDMEDQGREAEQSVDFDNMSQKELASYILGSIKEEFSRFTDKELRPIQTTLGSMNGFVSSELKEKVGKEIKSVQEEFGKENFEKYKPKMVELSKEFPSMGVRELFVMAKTRAGDLDFSKPRVSSEQPFSYSGSPAKTIKRTTPLPKGRSGFNQLISEHFEQQRSR
jgi:hypothetical protein